MRFVDIIEKKRDGYALTQEEISFWIRGYVDGSIPDYQVSALCMAIYYQGMNDDEIAVASCLSHMKTYVESGTEFYSLREALQDTYLSFMLEQAIETGETVKTETQSWSI